MRVIKIDNRRVTKKVLADVAEALRAGVVVAYPTDTAYGLAADPANPNAVRRIFLIKGREKGKPLPLIASSHEQAGEFVRFGGEARKLARQHWPGPLTIVAPKKRGRGTAAVRVPASSWACAIAHALGRPITSTSANLSGTPVIYSGSQVAAVFKSRRYKPDIVLDAGRLPKREVSTIVRLRRGKIEVLRKGAVVI